MKSKKKKSTKKNKQTGKRLARWLKAAGLIMMAGVVMLVYELRDIPNPRKLSSGDYPQSSRIFDRNGVLLYEFFSEKRRVKVDLNEVAENLKWATIAIEDAKFYRHFGFDIQGIVRALYRISFKKKLEGGSTITQQLVKNALLTPERTIKRKIKEAVLTVATELLYSKNEILEMYLNQTPYGGTFWGVEAAARGYFGKEPKDLSLAEAALIAGLPGAPTKYSPFSNPEAAKQRQRLVLQRMVDEGFISQEEAKKAEEEKLEFRIDKEGIRAPHFVFFVKDYLLEKYKSEEINEGGLDIVSSLNWEVQEWVEELVAKEVAKLDKYKISNGAVLVTRPKSGEILAMVGSKDYFAQDIDGKVNVTTALRQPGSSIKPLNYALGLETGKITAASIINDRPTCFKVEGQRLYCPTNYGNRYFGVQTVRNSLANSLNVPAVKVLYLNGVKDFVDWARRMGIETFKQTSDYGLSLTLGGGEVKMTEMAVAFGVLANGGVRQDLRPILKVSKRDGQIVENFELVPGDRVMSRETAFLIYDILSDDKARTMVFGQRSQLEIKDHPEVAVKTGTTNDLRDNWTIGYTPDWVVVVWVGNNDNSKMSWVASGVTGATPIWNKVTSRLLEDKQAKELPVPADMIKVSVCGLTGKLPADEDCAQNYEYFKKEYAPKEKAKLKRTVLVNKETGRMVGEGETGPNLEWQEKRVVEDIVGVKVCLDCPPAEEEKRQIIE